MDKVVISNLHEHAITNLKEMASVGTLISNKKLSRQVYPSRPVSPGRTLLRIIRNLIFLLMQNFSFNFL